MDEEATEGGYMAKAFGVRKLTRSINYERTEVFMDTNWPGFFWDADLR
ncbi:MAG: hypothetical protein KJ893_07060 [Candidatus Omnitrophica bacterium]|nr:hypothetical protein [Candidatus Omnitrophota bacterium]MBU4477888.1 hypothetical protein [Candidatus Omnitrophota bacterium]MCG2704216.1 hypothetical protein [Candidatus Omnitrophota bacterium]